MKLQHLFSMVLLVLCVLSCGKDDDPTPAPDENNGPEISDQTTSVSEGIAAGTSFYTVTANDDDGDDLAFSITANDNDLFAISNAGALSVASGHNLDAANGPHSITVSVSDQTDSDSATITINVTEEEETNLPPNIVVDEFFVSEDIDDSTLIGQVEASDPEGSDLTFAVETYGNLFEISSNGEITLIPGKSLDYESQTQYLVTIMVTDDVDQTAQVEITINVQNVIDTLFEDPTSFITTWATESNLESIGFGTDQNLVYEYEIDWGDGTYEIIDTNTSPSHEYAEAGEYTVAIRGQFPRIIMSNDPAVEKLMRIDQWGAIEWQSFVNAFATCTNLTLNALDTPNLSNVLNTGAMFQGATSFNGDLRDWDLSNVQIMFAMFKDATSFDQNLSAWDINSVLEMAEMFDNSGLSTNNYDATLFGWAFNQTPPDNISLGALGLTYCNVEARESLTNKGWNIDDGGVNPLCEN